MLIDINLLPEKIRERAVLLWVSIAILLAAAVSGLILYWLSQKNLQEAANTEASMNEVLRQQESLTSQIRQTPFAQEKDALAATVDFLQNYQFKTYPLIGELVELLPERGFFMKMTFTAPNEMNLEVQFDDLTEPALYLTRMKASEFITDATVEKIETDPVVEDNKQILPRYIASYFIEFVDERSLEPETDEDGEAIPPGEPVPPPDVQVEGGGDDA